MNILIVGPAWIGDMVMTQSLFKLLVGKFPQASIDVLAPLWSLSILSRMPEVRSAIPFPFKHGELKLTGRYRFAQQLRTNKYTRAIIIPNSFKSALVPYFAKIPERTGWKGEFRYGLLNDMRILDKQQLPLMFQRFFALGLDPGEELPQNLSHYYPSFRVSGEPLNKLHDYDLCPSTKPILALCPGAEFGETKRWLPEYFAEVARTKIEEGWDVWLFGSKNEAATTDLIMQLTANKCHNLAGRTTLEDAIDLLSLTSVVVANDSGLMHIAAALNRPLIAIYGATPSNLAPPLTKNARVLSLNLSCSPCFKRVCPLKHFKCMTDLKPSFVLDAIEEFGIT